MKLDKKHLEELVKQGKVRVIDDPKQMFSDGHIIVKEARIKQMKGENTRIIENLLASEAGKKKQAKKKASIPAPDKALFKGWQVAWYAKQYGHMAEHLRPTPKGKTWTRYSNFLEDAIAMWAKLYGYVYAKINVTGTYRKGVGFTPTRATKGVEDVQLIINGRTYAIEVKAGKDTQSEEQKERQEALKANGIEYVIIAHLEQFAKWAKQFE